MAQKLGTRDEVRQTFSVQRPDLDIKLHQTQSGAFQFGVGRDAKIVTRLEDVEPFGPQIRAMVEAWLTAHGPQTAYQARIEQDLHEASENPGTVDAQLRLLESIVPGVRGEILAQIQGVLQQHGIIRPATDAPTPMLTRSARTPSVGDMPEMVKAQLLAKHGLHNIKREFDPDLAEAIGDGEDVPDTTLVGPDAILAHERDTLSAVVPDDEGPVDQDLVGVGVSDEGGDSESEATRIKKPSGKKKR